MKTVHAVIWEDSMLQADIQKATVQVKRSFFKTLAETDGQGDSVMKETAYSY